jgi:hypothetical protein
MKNIPALIKGAALLLPGIAFMIVYNLRMEAQRYEPHIYSITGGKVLVAEITGDPEITRDTALVTLYSAGRKLKLSPAYMSARHPQWNQMNTKPRQDWTIYYSRVVPETATGLADIQDTAEVRIFYQRRDKTEIAEILHRGRYENIPESLVKLRRFIDSEGYTMSGFYEEVYLVFEQIEPNPGKYETLLRYQVSR